MKVPVPVFFSSTIFLLCVVGQVEGKYTHDLCQYSPTGKDNCLMLAWFCIGWLILWCCLAGLAVILLLICYCCCGLERDALYQYLNYTTGILLCCSCPCLIVFTLCRKEDEEDTRSGAVAASESDEGLAFRLA